MTTFLKRAINEEDAVSESDANEELYMKLFAKIGRDFVHKDDLKSILRELLLVLDPKSLALVRVTDDSAARARGQQYKALLEDNKLGTDIYDDLVDMEE